MEQSTTLIAELARFFDAEQKHMFFLLETIVNKESGSRDVEDVNQLGDFLADVCQKMGGKVIRQKSAIAGDPIACSFVPDEVKGDRKIVLVCHRDTVFPHGTVVNRPYCEDNTLAYGPGVADMKGGIVAGIFAIKALLALKDQIGQIPVEIIFSSDEEIGSSASHVFIAERCQTAKAAFFLEPARENGHVVIGRNGGDLLGLEVFGRSSHAGNAFAEGVSAIHSLAAVVNDFSLLSDDSEGYSVNVGLIGGGTGPIIVADYAWAKIYTRFSTLEQRTYLLNRLAEIVELHHQGGAKIVLSEPIGFLPFLPNEKNKELFSIVQNTGNELGIDIDGMLVRGAADAGITSCLGVPTICGMGPIGGNLHTDKEFMDKSSLLERVRLLALAIVRVNEKL